MAEQVYEFLHSNTPILYLSEDCSPRTRVIKDCSPILIFQQHMLTRQCPELRCLPRDSSPAQQGIQPDQLPVSSQALSRGTISTRISVQHGLGGADEYSKAVSWNEAYEE